jgi:hypothetical protein
VVADDVVDEHSRDSVQRRILQQRLAQINVALTIVAHEDEPVLAKDALEPRKVLSCRKQTHQVGETVIQEYIGLDHDDKPSVSLMQYVATQAHL